MTSHTAYDDLSPDLVRAGYRRCAQITREHGTTYYWGTLLLPPQARRHVSAVYALCRLADDIVDAPGATAPAQVSATRADLDAFEARFDAALAGESCADDATLAAIVTTARQTGIEHHCWSRFFAAMRQDLTVDRYASWDDLCGYMDGSAAVIGEMMLPILRPSSAEAVAPARALGLAFQVTNFLRDVDEDLDRGRVYLPADELAAFGVDVRARQVTPAWREFMQFQVARTRGLYAEADRGIAMLPPRSARCVRAARVLYSRILDLIEANDYDVFSGRLRVPTWRKALVAGRVAVGGRA